MALPQDSPMLPTGETTPKSSVRERSKPRNGLVFPWRLHQLLSESETNGNSSIVSWLPSGKSFKVQDKARFATEVMPAYFNSTKYKVRQMHKYHLFHLIH
jgi:hypothetical protein